MTNKPLTRKLLAVLLAVVILVGAMLTTTATSNTITVWEGDIATGLTKGTGTKADPFIISNGAELAYAVNNSKADTYYKLSADIYLNDPISINWKNGQFSGDEPNPWYKDVAVQGHFDGAGHTVYGLYYNGNNGSLEGTNWNDFTAAVALFPEIAADTTLTVANLGIDKAFVSSKQGAGALVGAKSENNATLATLSVSQCYVGQDVTLVGYDTGAFLAINRAVTTTLTDCYSLAAQTAASCSGLATDVWAGSVTMTRCYNGKGALDTKNTASCIDSYATAIGGKNAIVIEEAKMQGFAAAENMKELNSKYVTTSTYPALSLFIDQLDPDVNMVITTEALSSEANRELARKAVGEGLVLLKNNNNVLPLSEDNTVAFFGKGQNASYFAFGGGGSGAVYLNYTAPGPAEVFAEMAEQGKIGIYRPLYDAYMANSSYVPDTAMYEAAAKEADTAVVVITRKNGEGNDMSAGEWGLTDGEKALLQNSTNYFDNVIVLLNCNSSFCTDWSLDGNSYGIDADSVLVCHAPGEMGGYGIFDVMIGDVNPSGKLTDTYATSINDYPSTKGFYESDEYVNYTDDIYVGYRYFETFAPQKVVYEFGYGMSYTTFDIKTDSVTNDGKDITVKATVKNTGSVAGKEVVQVYFSAPQKGEGSAVLSKAAIELAGFAKTGLLAPGESQQVTITYAISDMSSYDDVGYTDYKSAYVLEAGTYDIFVGNSVKKNTKQGEYVVDTITVTEQLSKYGEVTLEERLEADGTYTNPSIPVLKDGQTFVKSDAVTVIEAENVSNKATGIRTNENFGSNGYLTDGYNWYSVPSGVVLGSMHSAPGGYFYYDLVVGKAGTYKFGFVTSDGNGNYAASGKTYEDLLTLEYSTNGTTWTSVKNFSVDSVNTKNNSDYTNKYWFNFVYTEADIDGNLYLANLPKGEVTIRFKIDPTLTGSAGNNYNANTNIDKFFIIPEGNDFGLAEVFEHYGLQLKPVLSAEETLWVEAEEYSTSGSTIKTESFTGQGFFNTGSKYTAISGSSVGTFHNRLNHRIHYDIIVEKAGTYNLGFIHSDGSKASYDAGKFGNNIFSIEYSTDGGATFNTTSSPAFDSVNTYGAISETGKIWFNFIYTNTDTEGQLYQVTLPAGRVTLGILVAADINGEAMSSVTNCNLDKFSISPADAPCTLQDACEMYGIEYAEVINSTSAMWFEGESFDTTGARVGVENFSANSGSLHDGTVYAALPAGAVVGFFDKNTTGYAEYNLTAEKAGTYNIGFTIGTGNDKAKNNGGKAPDTMDVLISSDGGATWVKQFALDVKYTGKDVTGTAAQWWNFYYSNTDFDSNLYQITIPAGSFKMRIACNENSPVYGGANIDKFVIYPTTMNYTEQNTVAYYFNSNDNTEDTPEDTELPDPIDVDFTTDNYVGITYADVLNGKATWEQLIDQMSLNEMIDLTYGKFGQWQYGYTGYIGFTTDELAEKYGIYAGDTADGPQGLRMEYKNTTFWPNATLQAATWNTELVYDIGEAVADECLQNNIDMWLAPGMNIHRSPLGGRNFEYYSEDPFVSGIIAAAIVNGLESKGVAATVKHYAVNNKETNRKFSDSRVSEKALREIYLEGFRIVIEKADPICVMSSYNLVNGEWTSTSEELLKGIMRDEWGYTGLIMSDWTTTPTIVPELNAGNNSKMLGSGTDADEIRIAMTYGQVTRETLEENTYYILSNLAKMPDNAINPNKSTELDLLGISTIRTTEYAKKSQRARIVINNNIFDVPGTQGYFYEYNVDVKTAGKYAIELEYTALSNMDNAFELYLNGVLVDTANNLVATNSTYTTAKTAICEVDLPEGRSTVRIKHIGSNGNVNYRALSFDAAIEGDVNNDGTVTICDLVYLENIILAKFSMTNSADLNGDGLVDALDATELRKMLIS
ncbi:MAG: glycoside hydrolase family 3 C-terminal domain-containing protein [Acutalibacteraceae bacterium]|nr:glycoside hydrolase family 3 C-terminal domain-containing protein [Acutalibacteraceae bacterium]